MEADLADKRRLLLKGATTSLCAQLASAPAGFALQVVLARALGASNFGVYSYVQALLGPIMLIAGFGLPNAAIRLIPEYQAQGEWGLLRGAIRGAQLLSLVSAVSAAAVGSAVALAFSSHPAAYIVGFWTLPLLLQLKVQTEIARGARQFSSAFLAPLVQPLIVIAALLAAIKLSNGLSPTIALAISPLGATGAFLLQRQRFRRWLYLKTDGTAGRQYEISRWLKLALPFLVLDSFFFLAGSIDTVIVGVFTSSKDVGLYAAVGATAGFNMFVMISVGAVAAPTFSELWTNDEREKLRRYALIATRWSFLPTLVSAAALLVFSGPLLGLFGGGFANGRTVLALLLLGQLLNIGTGYVGNLLKMTGHQNLAMRGVGAAAAVNLVCVSIGAYRFGVVGAAAGVAVSTAIWNLWLHQLVRRHLGITPNIIAALKTV